MKGIKEIEGFPGYYALEDGRIASSRGKVPRILKEATDRYGYKRVCLSLKNQNYYRTVHRLVASAFIDNLENKPQVNHKDGDKTNNHITNLEFMTGRENMEHAKENGLIPKGSWHCQYKHGQSGTKEYWCAQYIENKETIGARHKEYYRKNREKILKQRRAAYQEKKQEK